MRAWCAVAIALAAAGCLRGTSYRCASDGECVHGTQGRCEAVGFCSFPDPACPDGNRFADGAGPYANQCVGAGPLPDGGSDGAGDGAIDAPTDAPTDAPIDAPKCTTYAPIGASAHRYRLINGVANWNQQRNACVLDGGYLVVPDDAAELTAIATLTTSTVWVGVSDQVTEGTYVTVLGATATFLPWQPGQPDNNGGADCVQANLAAQQYADERCNNDNSAICECDP